MPYSRTLFSRFFAFILLIFSQSLYAQEVQKGESFEMFAVDTAAQYPGSQIEMSNFISKRLKYPSLAMEYGCFGKVFIQFIVETDGSLSDIQVMRNTIMCDAVPKDTSESYEGAKKSMENEALRIIKSMPHWQPAKQRGEAVRMRFILPIQYRLY